MVRTSGRAWSAAAIATALVLLAPAPALAASQSVSCSLSDRVLHVSLTAGDAIASTRIVVLDRSGTIGVEDGMDSGSWLDCDGARLSDVSTISVTGSELQDEVVISESGRGGDRSFPFPPTVAFDLDLGASDDIADPADGDILTLGIRASGGSASIGDGVFGLGAALGEYSGVEVGLIYVNRGSRGAGPSTMDASEAPSSTSVLLFGGTGKDVLLGGAGDDLLFGNEAGDLLDGGGGYDALIGGPGRDRCLDGDEFDTCEIVSTS